MDGIMRSLILLMILATVKSDIFSSMTDISSLLNTEGEMIRTLENYIHAQEKRLDKLKSNLVEMDRVHDLASQSPDFLGNPINAYLLVKRLTVDWADMSSSLTEDAVGIGMLSNLTDMAGTLSWPDEDDLTGAATAVMRLQDTYKLETSMLAKGDILGKKQAYRELTAADCFEVGRQAYNQADHYHCKMWMEEAMDRQGEEDIKSIPRSDILEYLAFSTYMQGHIRQALKLTNELLELKPDHQRAKGNKVYYEQSLANEANDSTQKEEDLDNEEVAIKKGYTVTENTEYMDEYQRERKNYERLCRGEGVMSDKMTKKLVCYFQYGPGKALKIGPVKTEVAHVHPTILIYHDVISDRELAVVKEISTPRMRRATVQSYKTGELQTASYRISKSAWLKTDENQDVYNLNSRIEQITGLNMDSSEELQVANYGLGGHYEPHFDYARREEKDAFKSLGTGNRIATFLIYMSDVSLGGATVFPRIELTLWPEKGAAAFWHNLHPNGEGDELTRHGACPVLVGTKWVSNKWIHERGQEFGRPCGLKETDLFLTPEHYPTSF